MISCKHVNCPMKYIGKTTTPINKRQSGHRANILNKTEGYPMWYHFTKYHSITDMVIKPIEFCNPKDLAEREKFWICEINTIYPYGLNDRIDINGIHDAYGYVTNNGPKQIYSLFNKVVIKRSKRGGRRKNKNNINGMDTPTFQADTFVDILLLLSTRNIIHDTRKAIMSLKYPDTRTLLLYVSRVLATKDNHYIYYLIKDICLFKLASRDKDTHKSNDYLIINYVNPLVDQINLQDILKSNPVKCLFPKNNLSNGVPSISYEYTNSIRSAITNYKETILIQNDDTVSCNCEQYPVEYLNTHHGHIITGNLNIINNNSLRSLFAKGLNYREKNKPDKRITLNTIRSAIDKYIYKICSKLGMSLKAFTPWKVELCKIVKEHLDSLTTHKTTKVLKSVENIKDLDKLKEDFVLVPIDKASKNLAIICKKFYLSVLKEEMLTSGNFEEVHLPHSTILNNCEKYKRDHCITIDKSCSKLPFMYWTPKLHKTPYGSRFITAGKDTVISDLSKIVGQCLQYMIKVDKSNSRYIHKYDDLNDFFIIDSRDPVIKHINEENTCPTPKSLKTYDFKTLYTSIPHNKLKDNMNKFINKVYQIKDKSYITISKRTVYFTKRRGKNISFSANELIEHIAFIIDNSYVEYKGKVYRQAIGIPMGTNSAPHIANIFLHVYEYLYIEHLLNQGHEADAKLLKNLFRFQDDCIIFKDEDMFDNALSSIYPTEMILDNTNINQYECNYLDLNISIQNDSYCYKSYDKRKSFGFEIVNYPNLYGNIPIAPAYGVFVSQLFRLCKINCSIGSFQNDLKEIVLKLVEQGFKLKHLRSKFLNFVNHKLQTWLHFGHDISSIEFLNSVFNTSV